MINTKELRQGNKVMVTFTEDQAGFGKDYIGEVVAINERKIRVKDDFYWIPLDTIFPVKLSPEMLYMSGFSSAFSSDPQEAGASKIFQLDGFTLHQKDERVNKFEIYNSDTHEWIEILSFHHLQNLYYYSFNESKELTLNPQP